MDTPRAAAPLGPSRGVVYKLSALFSLDAFAGGFVVQSLLALWLFERFDLSLSKDGADKPIGNDCRRAESRKIVPVALRLNIRSFESRRNIDDGRSFDFRRTGISNTSSLERV
jgi:hypothetical protein